MKLRTLEIRGSSRRSAIVQTDDSLEVSPFSPFTGQLVEQIHQAPVIDEAETAENLGAAAPSGRALLFVHGFGVAPESAVVMAQKVAAMLSANGRDYAQTTAVIWDARAPFAGAEQRADDTGEDQLRQEIEDLQQNGFEIDLVGHSLGCRPILACLRALSLGLEDDSAIPVTNAVLLAGAVRDEVLDEDKPHHLSPLAAKFLYVAHSNRDMVINGLFRIARFTGGLGGGGPERFWKRFDNEDDQRILSNIIVVDCVETIPDHGDYFQERHAAPVFEWLAQDMNRPAIEGGPWGHRIEGA
jgi:esterase/lipase superfamily enzyme